MTEPQTGGFRVDRRAALAKLKDYQLSGPAAFVLAWVRAAVAAGASWLRIETRPFLVLDFDGRAFRESDLAAPFDVLFSGSAPRDPRRHLAVGLLGALRLPGASVAVCSGEAGARAGRHVRSPETVDPLLPDTQGPMTRLILHGRPAPDGLAAELEAGLRLCPLRLTVDGKSVRRQGGPPDALRFEDEEVRGWLAPPADERGPSRIALSLLGVAAGELGVELPLAQVEAGLEPKHAPLELSQARLLSGEALRSAVGSLAARIPLLIERECAALKDRMRRLGLRARSSGWGDFAADGSLPGRPPWLLRLEQGPRADQRGLLEGAETWRRRVAAGRDGRRLAWLRKAALGLRQPPPGPGAVRARKALWSAPLLFDSDGRPLSLEALAEQAAGKGVPYTFDWAAAPGLTAVRVLVPQDREFLEELHPGRTVPLAELLQLGDRRRTALERVRGSSRLRDPLPRLKKLLERLPPLALRPLGAHPAERLLGALAASPLLDLLLEAPLDERVRTAYLASAGFSRVNREEPEVTDAADLAFQEALAAVVEEVR